MGSIGPKCGRFEESRCNRLELCHMGVVFDPRQDYSNISK